MVIPSTLPSFTTEEYLRFERESEVKHEKLAEGQWDSTVETDPKGSIFISSINCRVPLSEVYEWVVLSELPGA